MSTDRQTDAHTKSIFIGMDIYDNDSLFITLIAFVSVDHSSTDMTGHYTCPDAGHSDHIVPV